MRSKPYKLFIVFTVRVRERRREKRREGEGGRSSWRDWRRGHTADTALITALQIEILILIILKI